MLVQIRQHMKHLLHHHSSSSQQQQQQQQQQHQQQDKHLLHVPSFNINNQSIAMTKNSVNDNKLAESSSSSSSSSSVHPPSWLAPPPSPSSSQSNNMHIQLTPSPSEQSSPYHSSHSYNSNSNTNSNSISMLHHHHHHDDNDDDDGHPTPTLNPSFSQPHSTFQQHALSSSSSSSLSSSLSSSSSSPSSSSPSSSSSTVSMSLSWQDCLSLVCAWIYEKWDRKYYSLSGRVLEGVSVSSSSSSSSSPSSSSSSSLSVFHSSVLPPFSVSSYLRRLAEATQCSAATLLCLGVYLSRLSCHGVMNDVLAAHRILLATFVVANKFADDDDTRYNNAVLAKLGGAATVKELNELEREVLRLLDFNLYTNQHMLQLFCQQHFQLHTTLQQLLLQHQQAQQLLLQQQAQQQAQQQRQQQLVSAH